MPTKRKEQKAKAEAAKVVQAANAEMLEGFNEATVANALRAMSEGRKVIDEATGKMQDAGASLVVHADQCAKMTRTAGGVPSDAAWTKNVQKMLPMLAKEG